MNDFLLYYSWLTSGNNYRTFLSIKNHVPIDMNRMNAIKIELDSKKINFVSFTDEEYPNDLLFYKYPPYILYYKGNFNLLKNDQNICVTGEFIKNKEEESLLYFENNKKILLDNVTLVTNGFKNMDKNLIDYFKENNKPIIRIFANGFDFEKSEIDNDKELWISQYPPNEHARQEYFKERNLLTAALSKELIIFSSKEKSKIMNLANCFANVGKDVSCFPGINLEDGNNELIKNGARMITKITDVVFC